MLTPLDETLLHQTPDPFVLAGPSDHRFYDRYYVEAADPAGTMAIASGLGVYKNTNTVDGFVVVMHGDRQHNVRLSRTLRSDPVTPGVGPLMIEVVEPFVQLHWHVAPGSGPIAADIEWTAIAPAVEEAQHVTRSDGRLAEDVHRYNQAGRARGWVEVEGDRVEFDEWWATRDHSWGVRPSTGGFEPRTRAVPEAMHGFLYTWFAFSNPELTGYLQVHEGPDGRRVVFDGAVRHRAEGAESARIAEADLTFSFPPGSRNYERAEVRARTVDGAELMITARRLLPPFVMRGTGYDSGYLDGRGLGAFRGDHIIETDVFQIVGEDVVVADSGVPYPCFHREQLVHIEIDGVPGTGHFTVLPVGELPQHGLGAFTLAELAALSP